MKSNANDINGNGIIIGQAIEEVISSSQQFNYQIVMVIKVKLNNTNINIKDNVGNVIIAVPKNKPKIPNTPVELIIKRSISIPKDAWLLSEVRK